MSIDILYMYWIYLVIFVLAVFSPDIVHRGLFFLQKNAPENEVRMLEELSIFLFGVLGFLIFFWKEKQLKFNIRERSKFQKEASQTSKDLKNSYLYIGEINRKLEILKNIALGFSENSLPFSSSKLEIYNSITEALKMLGKTNSFIIRIVDEEKNNTIKEIYGQEKIIFKIKNSSLKLMEGKNYIINDDYYIFRSPQKIDNIRTYIIIQRETNRQIEDTKLIKMLATQILFLYILTKKYKTKIELSA